MLSRSSLSLSLCLVAAAGAPLAPCQAAATADDLLRKAIAEQQRGDLKSAIEDYRKALAIKPDMGEARANLGAALSAAGDLDGAIREDSRALENAPDKTGVRMNLGLAYYKKGDWQHAQQEFAKVVAARPSDVNAAMLLGYSNVKLGRAAEAVALLLPLEPGQESNMDFEYVLGYALVEAGKPEGLPRLEKSAAATHSVDAYVIAGAARLHRREFKEARADLDEALNIDPNFPGAQTLAGQARDALGDTAAALPAFEAALRQDPRDLMANLYLGTMRLKDRDLDGARPLLQTAYELAPQLPQARLQWAKLNSMTGKYAEAAAMLEELEKADPNWIDPHIELAALYYKLHRPDDGKRERDIVQQLEAKEQNQGPSR
ncbi:tetratricopeptide repeat protein [Occallatibacter riparius]|uniref:Tetratricopeptide repeat protein n=1 Tax=Occallatibacter riparius TaxID=1002689 RepID=A0A9J7BV00_9BACT|nr:tetratricopeptide repeat protein [Occallatibacter riparius]UWZ85594.1 tetratricopeptide repeat protein [Occallatibacter riparius]